MDCKYCGHSAVGLTDTCGDCWHTWINDAWQPVKKPASRASRDRSPKRAETMVALRESPVSVA